MDGLCPKCGAPKKGAPACARCGLVFARFDPSALAIPAPGEIEALWRHAEEAWDDRTRHALFTERALASGAAAYAASRYRERGPDDPVAVEQLSRIAARLEQELARSSSSDGRRGGATDGRGKTMLFLVAVILFLVVGALGIALALR